ncbi:MAG TPA: PAS domain-containing protein [Candidatus Thermoplasmatota archaeon]|nr:PAS domain-containing protein [Candidatus Thermoplasmatota archaeon]
MGDRRYEPALLAVKRAPDRAAAVRALEDDAVVSALAASARDGDGYLANVLATEAHNRLLRMRAVTDSMRDGVFVADASGAPLYVNPALVRILGFPADELLHGKPPMHGSPEDEARYRKAVREALAQEDTVTVEYEMRRGDGSPVWTEHTIAPLRDVGGRLVGYVGIVRDVSAAREAIDRLRRKGALLDAIFATTQDALVVVDEDLRVTRASAAFAARVGRPVESVVGLPLRDVLPPAARAQGHVVREVLATGRAFESCAEADGDGNAWDWHALPLPGADGRTAGVLLAFRDVTDRREGVRRFVPQ